MVIIAFGLLSYCVKSYQIAEVNIYSQRMEKFSMDELPFLVVLIRRLRAVAVWIVAVIFAVLLYFDFTEDEYVAAVLTSVFIFLIFVIVVTIIFKKFFSDNSKDKE